MTKRDKRIRDNLRRHAELTREFQLRGLSREEASKRAFDLIVKAAPQQTGSK